MNKKVEKLRAERTKNDAKLAELTARNQEIDRKIEELENTDIIGLVRKVGITPDQLAVLIHSQTFVPTDLSVTSSEGVPEHEYD